MQLRQLKRVIRKFAHRKYFFVLETLLFAAILVLINLTIVPGAPGFLGINPNPHWITLLLIASRYGTGPGVFAAGISSVLVLAAALLSGQLADGQPGFPHGAWQLPLLFLVVAGILGETRSLYRKRFDKLTSKHIHLRGELADLGALYSAVVESKTALEKRISTQTTTLLSLFDKLNQIGNTSAENVYVQVLELLQEQMNVTCASVYLLSGRRLNLKIRHGEPGSQKLPDSINLTEGIMGRVMATKRLATINQVSSEAEMRRAEQLSVMMAAPILREDESIIGILAVERIPFIDFNSHSVRIFEKVAAWVSTILDERIRFEEARERDILDAASGAYTYSYFEQRLRYEILRAHRFHARLSLVLFRLCEFEKLPPKTQNDLLMVFNLIFKNLLHETEIVSRYSEEEVFGIIFCNQPGGRVSEVMTAIQQEIENFRFKPFVGEEQELRVRFGVAELTPKIGDFLQLTAEAEAALDGPGARRRELPRVVSAEEAGDEAFRDLGFIRKRQDAVGEWRKKHSWVGKKQES